MAIHPLSLKFKREWTDVKGVRAPGRGKGASAQETLSSHCANLLGVATALALGKHLKLCWPFLIMGEIPNLQAQNTKERTSIWLARLLRQISDNSWTRPLQAEDDRDVTGDGDRHFEHFPGLASLDCSRHWCRQLGSQGRLRPCLWQQS